MLVVALGVIMARPPFIDADLSVRWHGFGLTIPTRDVSLAIGRRPTMNIDTLNGAATDLGGKLKEGIGAATGNEKLRGQGKADQLGGTVQQHYGDAKDAVETTVRPLIDQVRQFAHERPFLAATLAGVAAIAVVNTLRGE